MATTEGLLVRIAADTSEFRKGLNATKRQIRDAFGSDFLSVSQQAATALAGIGVAVAAIGAKSIVAASKLQTVQTAFTNMLGSAEKSAAFVKDLQEFAAKTPFELSQVTSAAQKFLAFGFTAEQVIPTLTAVGDAAAGVGLGADGIDRVTLALGQIAAKARVQSDEMLQLTEAGIPAWQMLADKIGVTVPQAMDMVTKGMVDAQTGISALVEGMNTKFGGMMAQQSQTIQGTWSTMMDGMEQASAQVGLRLAEALDVTSIFQGIGETLTNFASVVQTSGIAEAFKTAIPTEFSTAMVALSAVLVGVAIPAISLAVTSLIGFAAPLIAAVAEAAPFIAAGAAIASALYLMWENGVSVNDVLDYMCISTDLLNSVIETSKGLFYSLGDLLQGILKAAQPLITVIGVILVGVFKTVCVVVGQVINFILGLQYLIMQFATGVANVCTWVLDVFGIVRDGIGDALGWMVDSLLPEWASSGIKTISNFVGKAVGWLNKLIAKIFETNDALAEADGKEVQNKKPAPIEIPVKPEIPDYKQFAMNTTAPNLNTSIPNVGSGVGKSIATTDKESKAKSIETSNKSLEVFKKTEDDKVAYYAQCKDIRESLDKAYAHNSYTQLKDTLNKENMARLSAYSEAQTIMQSYYDAATEAHMSFEERMANAIDSSKNSFSTFFTDVLTMQASFSEAFGTLLESLFNNIVSQITAGWASSITQGMLGFLMPGGGGGDGDSGTGENPLAGFDSALTGATASIGELTKTTGGANSIIGTGTGIMSTYNGINSLIAGTTKPAEGAATTAVTVALTTLATAATTASLALSAMAAKSSFGLGFFAKGGLVKAAGGGAIRGAGTGTSDSIPAMLSNGEYVLTARAVERLGEPFLNALNSGDLPGYNDGGVVAPDYAAVSVKPLGGGNFKEAGNGGGTIHLNMNISTVDASSFEDFLNRGGLDTIRQALFDNGRNFATDSGVW